MPNFALVSPYLPAPDNTGGRIRIHRLARALRRHGDVDLFACVHPLELSLEAGDTDPALSIYRSTWMRPRDLGAVLPLINPARVRASCPWRLRRDLAREHSLRAYDAVISCHSYAFGTSRALANTTLVLDEHNVESAYHLSLYPHELRESALLSLWERMAWRACDMVSAVTPDDVMILGTHALHPPFLAPNGVDFTKIKYLPPSQRGGREILFIASMSHPPNVKAAVELVTEVLPEIQRFCPEATVTLCGRSPSPEVLALGSRKVHVTGTVPDLGPLLDRASVYVNLLRHGAGSSLKVPEALSAGLPMVSTRVGVRGFSLYDPEHLRIADHPAEISRAVLEVWRDPCAADARADRAREFSRALDWTALGEAWAQSVLGAIEARKLRG